MQFPKISRQIICNSKTFRKGSLKFFHPIKFKRDSKILEFRISVCAAGKSSIIPPRTSKISKYCRKGKIV